ncbi:MAG: helix-turn-helix transcriptional regulator [Desulfobacteraceae bacterium]|jgi:transcriptional regulator with XRE-family HTH domain
MDWLGENIKIMAKSKKISIAEVARLLQVSRQTVNDWIKGQVPKGNHLVGLSSILGVDPIEFFSKEASDSISLPAHRTRRSAKVNAIMDADALELAKEYENFFRNCPENNLVPVVRVTEINEKSALKIAKDLRNFVNVQDGIPIDYQEAFSLMKHLGIKIIFRYFPEKIKSYAFYTKIHGHRVVFVNNSTNVIDLIFQLIHESVHAIRDEVPVDGFYSNEEEKFCDMVANFTQFPDVYVDKIYKHIDGQTIGAQINTLKLFSKDNKHSLFGIVESIKKINHNFKLNVGGADTNLKKEFPLIGDILFSDSDPRNFVERLNKLSPLFVSSLAGQIDNITDRKLAELLGLDNGVDGKELRNELLKVKD